VDGPDAEAHLEDVAGDPHPLVDELVEQAERLIEHAPYRSDRNAARSSSLKISGCSHAAKWPPFSTWL
jgi:hypothetical protein